MSLAAQVQQAAQAAAKYQSSYQAQQIAAFVQKCVEYAEKETGGLVPVEVLGHVQGDHPVRRRQQYGGYTVGRSPHEYVRLRVDDIVIRAYRSSGGGVTLHPETPCSCCGQVAQADGAVSGYISHPNPTPQEKLDSFARSVASATRGNLYSGPRQNKCWNCAAEVPAEPCPTCGRKS